MTSASGRAGWIGRWGWSRGRLILPCRRFLCYDAENLLLSGLAAGALSMRHDPEPHRCSPSGDRRVWVTLGLLSVAACAPAPSEGFVPADSFFAASQNCDALQEVSDQHCGAETIPAYCFGLFLYEEPENGAFVVTELPAYTCEDALDLSLIHISEPTRPY